MRALALLAATLLAACTGSPAGPSPGSAATGDGSRTLACTAAVRTRPLPTWARAGFTPPGRAVPHVTGVRGDIVGVVFGNPLRSPPAADHRNKILWVARVASGDSPSLEIHAKLNGSDVAVAREVAGGPGPSIIDMPRAGCWTFALTWSGHRDRLAVPYSG